MAHLKYAACDERVELYAALDEVTMQHMSIEGRLVDARAVRRERVNLRAEAEMECKEMECEIAQQNKIQVSLRQETYMLKKAANALQDEVADMELALREVKAEERILRKEVVSSPDQVRIDLADASSRLNEVKRRIVERVNDKALVQKRIDNANIALLDDGGGGGGKEKESGGSSSSSSSMTRILHTLDTLDMSVQDYEMAKEDMENANHTLATMEVDKGRILSERVHQQTKLDMIEKQKVDSSTRLGNTLRAVQNELTTATTKLGAVESELVDGMKKIDVRVERNTKLETMIHAEKERSEANIVQLVTSFHKFEESYLTSEEKLHSSLASPRGVDDVIFFG